MSQPFWLKVMVTLQIFGDFCVILGNFDLRFGQCEELEYKAFIRIFAV